MPVSGLLSPPYYDAIPYIRALSDFFLVWLRRTFAVPTHRFVAQTRSICRKPVLSPKVTLRRWQRRNEASYEGRRPK